MFCKFVTWKIEKESDSNDVEKGDGHQMPHLQKDNVKQMHNQAFILHDLKAWVNTNQPFWKVFLQKLHKSKIQNL